MKKQNALKIGLVDPIRTGRHFLAELDLRKLEYLVIESGIMAGVPEVAGNSGRFIQAAPSIELMAEKLSRLGVTHLIGCFDQTTTYADQLCAQMGLPFNGLRLSEARRNKALMIETLRKADIRVPRQFETAQVKHLLAWVDANKYPVVLKPVDSGGTDNVYLCDSVADVDENFHKILHAKNLAGEINTSVLAQEYVDGVEYIVDCVSSAGVHSSIAFFEYQKGTRNGRAFIYEKVTFLKSDHPVSTRLREFAYRVLDKLDVRDGASHMEVKINSRDEIVFIEVGVRISGGDSNRLVQSARADGKSQIQYVLDAIQGLPLPSDNYETAHDVVRVCVISEAEGRLKSFRNLESIQSLRSFAFLDLRVKPGQRVSKTISPDTLAGYVELVHTDPSILAEDQKRLDEILSQGVLVFE